MSATPENTPGARRSQRERKTVKPFVSGESVAENLPSNDTKLDQPLAPSTSARKRKRPDTDAEDEDATIPNAQADDEREDEEADVEDEEGEEGYESAKPKPVRKPKAKAPPKDKPAPAPKKPREPKTTTRKAGKIPARRGRKVKDGEDTYDAEQVARDTKIAADNPLFSA
jgi:cohesin complex subunit SA-1/2